MRGQAEIGESPTPVDSTPGRRRRQVVHDVTPVGANPAGAVVDVEKAPAHGGDTGHTPNDRLLHRRVEVEKAERAANPQFAEGAGADVLAEEIGDALALELAGPAIGRDVGVPEQASRDRADEPEVAEREEYGLAEPPPGEISAHERVLLLRVNHIGASPARLGRNRAREEQVEERI